MNHLTPVTRVIVWSLELMHMFLFLPKASILNISQILSNVTLFKTLLWVPSSPKSPQSSVKAYNSTLWLIAIRYYPSSFSFSLPLCKLIPALGLLHWFLCTDLMFLIHLGCNVSTYSKSSLTFFLDNSLTPLEECFLLCITAHFFPLLQQKLWKELQWCYRAK